MPLSINWVKLAGELLAGPMVQTILAFRMFIWKRLHAAHPAEVERISQIHSLETALAEDCGGDFCREIPENSAVSQAVRKFLPVIEGAPESPASKGLLAVSTAVEHLVAT